MESHQWINGDFRLELRKVSRWWGFPIVYKAIETTDISCYKALCIWLVVWLPSILFSHSYWEYIIIPIDEVIFFGGVAQPPTSKGSRIGVTCFQGLLHQDKNASEIGILPKKNIELECGNVAAGHANRLHGQPIWLGQFGWSFSMGPFILKVAIMNLDHLIEQWPGGPIDWLWRRTLWTYCTWLNGDYRTHVRPLHFPSSNRNATGVSAACAAERLTSRKTCEAKCKTHINTRQTCQWWLQQPKLEVPCQKKATF